MQKLQKTSKDDSLENYEPEAQIAEGVHSKSMAVDRMKDTCQVAKTENETNRLLEKVLDKGNIKKAYEKVKKNKGAGGIDGIEINQFEEHLKENWKRIEEEIREGKYKPKEVKRVEIPKPDGSKRKLGIPTLVDRLIQQAMLQILSPIFEKEFSNSSYGFRPNKSAHSAVEQARKYIEEGNGYVVDIDLEKFFDTVNHDRLMAKIAKKIQDKKLLKLIRRYLQAGVMIEGIKVRTEKGTPQGSPLSPLLANIVLDELDKEIEKRGHKFCRYADDCNIYVKSKRAGERVMKGIRRYIEKELKLKINEDKSDVDRPNKRKFLGFTFYKGKEGKVRITIAKKTKERMRKKIKELTQRKLFRNLEEAIKRVNQYTRGWINYYRIGDINKFVERTEAYLRRRLRMNIWKQWKKVRTRYKNLKKLGLKHQKAYEYSNTRKGYWRISNSPILTRTLTNEYFRREGLNDFRVLSIRQLSLF